MIQAKVKPEDIDEVVMVGESSRIPIVIQAVKEIFKKQPNLKLNLIEAVAIGAALQGAILNNEIKDALLLDVTPLALGIETVGGDMSVIIKQNTAVPTFGSETFSTVINYQKTIEINVLQGESVTNHQSIGRFVIQGIPLAPQGATKIIVRFDINVDGTLKVTSRDSNTNKEYFIVNNNFS